MCSTLIYHFRFTWRKLQGLRIWKRRDWPLNSINVHIPEKHKNLFRNKKSLFIHTWAPGQPRLSMSPAP